MGEGGWAANHSNAHKRTEKDKKKCQDTEEKNISHWKYMKVFFLKRKINRWGLGCGIKANHPYMRPGPARRVPYMWGRGSF